MEPTGEPEPDPRDVLELREQGDRIRAALAALTADEREAIETTFFGGLTHVEAARRLDQPLGTVKTRIRSGLHKLRELAAFGGEGIMSTDATLRPERDDQRLCSASAPGRPNWPRRKPISPPAPLAGASSRVLRDLVGRLAAWPTDVVRPRAIAA